MQVLFKHSASFAWDYADMKGIHPDIFQHHIYIKDDATPIQKPQRTMNPTLRYIFKE